KVGSDTSGWNCTPHAASPTRNAWWGYMSLAASHTDPAGKADTASACMLGPGYGSGSPAINGSDDAGARQRTSTTPDSRPAGADTSTRPPQATASSWAPRQMPSVGTADPTDATRRSRTAGSQGATASSYADIWPPSTIRPPSTAGGTASPAYGRTTSKSTPSNHSPMRSSGHAGSCSMTEMRRDRVGISMRFPW